MVYVPFGNPVDPFRPVSVTVELVEVAVQVTSVATVVFKL